MIAEPLDLSSLLRRPSLAVVLAMAYAFSAEARAATPTDHGPPDVGSHDQLCKCGPKCRGASCCCGPRKPKAARGAKAPLARISRAELADNPCLDSAPCRDPILPPSAPAGSTGKLAVLTSFEWRPPSDGRRLLPCPSPRLSSDRRASRLDRPPKALAPA